VVVEQVLVFKGGGVRGFLVNMRASNSPRVCSVRHVDINLFARWFGERFDFPRSHGYARCLVNAAVRRKSLESIYNNYGGLPPDSFFLFFKYPMSEVVEATDWFFSCQAELLDLHGCTVAVDMNDEVYWGDYDDVYVHPKKGVTKNTYVLRQAVVSFVDEKRRFALACLPVSRNDRLADVVRTLLEKAGSRVLIDTVLLDRGFYDSGVLRTVEEMGMHYVIPLRKTKGSDRIWEESKKNGTCKQGYTLKGEAGHLQTWLYLDEKEKKKPGKDCKKAGKKRRKKQEKKRIEREYVGVLSNKDVCPDLVQDFMDWYFVRNNVEIGFKEKNHYKILTSSTDKAYRFLIYCISLYLMNLVQVVRTVNNTFFRNDEMKKLVKLLLKQDKPLTGEYRLTRILVVIA